MGITVIGLGPGPWERLTLEAKELLEGAQELYLRTIQHPTVATLPKHLVLHSFDHYDEEQPNSEAVQRAIVEELLALAQRRQEVLYAVPGHPLIGEATIRHLLERAPAQGLAVRLVPGQSFVEPLLEALGLDPLARGLRIADAPDTAVDPAVPALFCQVYSRDVAVELKLRLLELYPSSHLVTIVSSAGLQVAPHVQSLPLEEMDRRGSFEPLTCVYVPPLSLEEDLNSFSGLRRIVARLRSPQGCPWDRAQTHDSIKQYLLEECYETLEALDSGDTTKLREELGDLLMQVLLHAQIATEANEFTLREVIRGIASKLVRRHPHVFGELQVADAAEVWVNWENLKRQERGEESSLLDSVPPHMPALAYAQAVQQRVGRVGLSLDDRGNAPKLPENERSGEDAAAGPGRQQDWGELFFALAWQATAQGVDVEEALRKANRRFRERFRVVETLCRERGLALDQLSSQEQQALWHEAMRQVP